MSEQHTPELLQIADDGSIGSIQTVTGISIGHTFQVSAKDLRNGWPIRRANAARLVACWNACDGIDTADLKSGSVSIIHKLHDEAAKMVLAQRDELLAAMLRIASTKPQHGMNPNAKMSDPADVKVGWNVHLIAKAAIAKVEGGA